MLQFKENYERKDKVHGELTFYSHKGGEFVNGEIVGGELLEVYEVHNLIVDSASRLMAARMAPGAVTGASDEAFAGNFVDHGLQYLAVGVGTLIDPDQPFDEDTNYVDTAVYDLQNPPAETLKDTKLTTELYRKRFTSWCFVDVDGTETDELTNVLKLTTTFYEDEANGPITELGIFGGNAQDWNEGLGANSGILFNHKCFAVWNKINNTRLTIVWRITF